MDVETLLSHARRLHETDKLYLHREVSRLCAPLYRDTYEDRYWAGVAAARSRTQALVSQMRSRPRP